MGSAAKPNELTPPGDGGCRSGGRRRPGRGAVDAERARAGRGGEPRADRAACQGRMRDRAHGHPAARLPGRLRGRLRGLAPAGGGRRPLRRAHSHPGGATRRGQAAHQSRQHRRPGQDRRRRRRGRRDGHPHPHRRERGFARRRARGARRSDAAGEAGRLGGGLRAALRGPWLPRPGGFGEGARRAHHHRHLSAAGTRAAARAAAHRRHRGGHRVPRHHQVRLRPGRAAGGRHRRHLAYLAHRRPRHRGARVLDAAGVARHAPAPGRRSSAAPRAAAARWTS